MVPVPGPGDWLSFGPVTSKQFNFMFPCNSFFWFSHKKYSDKSICVSVNFSRSQGIRGLILFWH